MRHFRQEVEAEAEAAGVTQVFLCCEVLHETPHIRRLAEAFAKDDVTVLLFLRDYVDYLSSWYREDIQISGLCCDFPSYAVLKRKPYLPLVRRWSLVFGKEVLVLRDYNRDLLRNGSICDEILSTVIGIDDATGWTTETLEDNPSLWGNLLFFKRLLNNYVTREEATLYRYELKSMVACDSAFRRPMEISGAFCSYLLRQEYKADQLRLEQEFGFHLTVRPGTREGTRLPDLDQLRQDYVSILAASAAQEPRFGARLSAFAPALVL